MCETDFKSGAVPRVQAELKYMKLALSQGLYKKYELQKCVTADRESGGFTLSKT